MSLDLVWVMAKRGWIDLAVFMPILTGLVLCYANYLYIRYNEQPPAILPMTSYQIERSICEAGCENINQYHCKEWHSVAYPDMCQYYCDTGMAQDDFDNVTGVAETFSCASTASSLDELHACSISCSIMSDL